MSELSESEMEFVKGIKNLIDQFVSDDIENLTKLSMGIDPKKLEEKAEKKVISMIEQQLIKASEIVRKCLEMIKYDDDLLYDRLAQSIQGKNKSEEQLAEEAKSLKTVEDFREFSSPLFSREEIDEIYTLGEKWFIQRDFEKSTLYFSFLSCISPKDSQIWFVKGMSEQYKESYPEALLSYSFAINLDSSQMVIYLHIIECLIALSRLEEANQIYELIVNEVKPDRNEFDEYEMAKFQEIGELLKT